MSKKKQQATDLTSPEAVAKGRKAYDRIVSGQVKAKDVTAELNKSYGRLGDRG